MPPPTTPAAVPKRADRDAGGFPAQQQDVMAAIQRMRQPGINPANRL